MTHFGRANFIRTQVLRALLPLFFISALSACAPSPDMRRSVPNAFSGSGTAAVGHTPFAPVGNTGRGEWRMIPGAP